MADDYRAGDHWVIDDTTGQKVRASETRKQWNGLLVSKHTYEARHPQELIRGRRETIAVQDPRPRPIDAIIGPLTTTISSDTAAGATTIPLASSVRMQAGDQIKIMLDSGDACFRIIGSVPDAVSITIIEALPWAASTGKAVIDMTAMAEPTLP